MSDPVIIVGAGPAGIGMAAVLADFNVPDVVVLDRHEVGASFCRWPQEMRLITPSFNSTPFGALDLNAVCLNTSVAHFLDSEHPTGREYASYLRAVVQALKLTVITPCDVRDVWEREGGGFILETDHGRREAGFLVWAAGEFQFPRVDIFPGSELCRHNATIPSYRDLEGPEAVIIGAFESGVDAAVHLARLGRRVDLLNAGANLAVNDQDPSRSLSPFTRARLRETLQTRANLELHHEAKVIAVEKSGRGFLVRTAGGKTFRTKTPPILATGFRGGTGPVDHLFDYREDGEILLNGDDESTLAPGLFLAGPLVRHDQHIFCFIYKFRQRFAIIAETIANRLGLPVSDEMLVNYERNQMRLVDLSCCGQTCAC
jgi:putative flavoprotein involved in K+ transport